MKVCPALLGTLMITNINFHNFPPQVAKSFTKKRFQERITAEGCLQSFGGGQIMQFGRTVGQKLENRTEQIEKIKIRK